MAITFVSPKEDQDAKETIELLKKCKTEHSKDPVAIPADLGNISSCEHVRLHPCYALQTLNLLSDVILIVGF